MKKFFVIFCIAIGFFSTFLFFVKALSTTPTDVIYDYECQRRILLSTTGKDADGNPKCNVFCSKAKIFTDGIRNDQFCKFNSVSETTTLDAKTIDYFIPPEDAMLIYLRAGLYAFFSFGALTVVLYGIYGWYVRSMSGGNPEKVALSMSIYKNAILGMVMIFSAFAIIQLVYVFIGISASPFDFNFIPRICLHCDVKSSDVGRQCWANQSDINGKYKCVDEKWQ